MVCSLLTIVKTALLLTSSFQVHNNLILNNSAIVGIHVVYKSHNVPIKHFLVSDYPSVHECYGGSSLSVDTLKVSVPSVNITTSVDTPVTRPSGTLAVRPSTTPATRPSTTQATRPSTTPATRPSTTPATRPSTTPATRPSGTPATRPSGTPATRPSGTPAGRPTRRYQKRNDKYLYCFKSVLHLSRGSWEGAMLKESSKKPSVIEGCSNVCRSGYKYFGIDSGTKCWCSRRLPRARPVRKSLCKPCFDNPELSCGDVNYGMTSLYKILYSPVLVPQFYPVYEIRSNSSIAVSRSDDPVRNSSLNSTLGSPLNQSLGHNATLETPLNQPTLNNITLNSIENSNKSSVVDQKLVKDGVIPSRKESLVPIRMAAEGSDMNEGKSVQPTTLTKQFQEFFKPTMTPEDSPNDKVMDILDYSSIVSHTQDTIVKEMIEDIFQKDSKEEDDD